MPSTRNLFGGSRIGRIPRMSLAELQESARKARGLLPPAVDQYDPTGEGLTRQQGPLRRAASLFGSAFSGKNLPHNLQVVGAALRQVDGDEPALDNLIAEQHRQELEAQLMGERKQDRAWEAEDRAREIEAARAETERRTQLERLIESLPPGERELARLDPEGYVRGIMRHRFPSPSSSRSSSIDPTPPLPRGFVLD